MNQNGPRILVIGAGRAAFHLGHGLVRSGQNVIGVAARDLERARTLANELHAEAYALNTTLPACDLVLLAVSDSAIAQVAAHLPRTDAVMVSCSGAASLELLQPHTHRGVLWPVQALSEGPPVDLAQVPLVVDASDDTSRTLIHAVAGRLGHVVHSLDHGTRMLVHLAAVLTSNLPVFLVGEAHRLLAQRGLPAQLLEPLWKTTAANVLALGPAQALTGPARRGDEQTMAHHRDLLAAEPDLRQAYELLSNMIGRTYGSTSHDR